MDLIPAVGKVGEGVQRLALLLSWFHLRLEPCRGHQSVLGFHQVSLRPHSGSVRAMSRACEGATLGCGGRAFVLPELPEELRLPAPH